MQAFTKSKGNPTKYQPITIMTSKVFLYLKSMHQYFQVYQHVEKICNSNAIHFFKCRIKRKKKKSALCLLLCLVYIHYETKENFITCISVFGWLE